MVCSATIAAAATALTLVSGEVTVIGTEAPFPPYTYLDDAGVITGFDRDVGDEVCRRAGLTCEWVNVRFDRLIPGVMSGEFDIIMGGIAKSPERMNLIDFTLDYSFSSGLDDFVGPSGAPEPDAALIGVQSGTIQEKHLRDTGRRYVSFGTEQEVLEALTAGRVDLAFGPFHSDAVGDYFAENGIEWLYQEDAGENGIGMAVCKGNADLLERLDAALGVMLSDGTLDRMSEKWF